MNLTKPSQSSYTCAIAAIVASKFESLEHKGMRAISYLVDGFFVPIFHPLVVWAHEASSLLGSLCDQSFNLRSSRLFLFESENGGNSHKEVSL